VFQENLRENSRYQFFQQYMESWCKWTYWQNCLWIEEDERKTLVPLVSFSEGKFCPIIFGNDTFHSVLATICRLERRWCCFTSEKSGN